MRTSLRRACDACIRAKQKCTLETPRCSRCAKRSTACVYANEPLAGGAAPGTRTPAPGSSSSSSASPPRPSPGRPETRGIVRVGDVDASPDPFDTYPPIRIARRHVQRLIHHFLSAIAFQYYPLDPSPASNPFVTAWWPLALADPALFHVSLQTASLASELHTRSATFPLSTMLMAESVRLLREKLLGPASAARGTRHDGGDDERLGDATLNAVVTLAAIEHGKGNARATAVHLAGGLRIVEARGGIARVRRQSPLTGRMTSWVAMLVTGAPRFAVQTDDGEGDGIAPTAQWRGAAAASAPVPILAAACPFLEGGPDAVDPATGDVLGRLRRIFQGPPLATTDLHDLACFAIHKLLLLPPLPLPEGGRSAALSACLRYGAVLYLLAVHGTTYYHNMHLIASVAGRLRASHALLGSSSPPGRADGAADRDAGVRFWVAIVCAVTAGWMPDGEDWRRAARAAAARLRLRTWEDALAVMRAVLWMPGRSDALFAAEWARVRAVRVGATCEDEKKDPCETTRREGSSRWYQDPIYGDT